MEIRITSKLTKNQQQRLRRAAERNEQSQTDAPYGYGFFKATERNCYYPSDGYKGNMHDLARSMMVVAGITFAYDIVN